jgi:transposase
MTLSFESEAEILRLAFNEEWPVGSIAKHLGVHRSVVERVLSQSQDVSAVQCEKRPKLVENYKGFLRETIEKYPDIHASRLFAMVKKRGYTGRSASHFRKIISELRPKKNQEAFARLSTLPGEQAQVDWADFGKVSVGKAVHKLMAFVMTLSWSRTVFVQFYFSARMPFFQQGFVDAFEFFNGVPRIILHDNLKSGVIERVGSIIRFNDDFLLVCKHYLFEPRAVNVRRGNEKGRVERSIKFVRENFFSGREWTTIEELNEQVLEWCLSDSLERPWRRGESKLVKDAFREEKEKLNPLPATLFLARERLRVSIGKTPFARFHTNDYSVPPEYVGKLLDILASHSTVQFIDGLKVVATHTRSWGRCETIEDPIHQAQLRERKKKAQMHSGLARLIASIPEGEQFVSGLAERGQHVGGGVSSLLKLLDLHGKEKLSQAIKEVLLSGAIHLKNIHHVLKRLDLPNLKQRPSVPMNLSSEYSNITVTHHNLSHYDKISEDTYDK